MIRVKATREGLIGEKTASGVRIDTVTLGAALPSVQALHRKVKISNPINGLVCVAEVLDVGPWSECDDNYVFRGDRPLSESKKRIMYHDKIVIPCPKSNGAGIDLWEATWRALGMVDNSSVDWEWA